MLPIGNAAKRASVKSTYICLQCRLRSSQSVRSFDPERRPGAQSLEQHGISTEEASAGAKLPRRNGLSKRSKSRSRQDRDDPATYASPREFKAPQPVKFRIKKHDVVGRVNFHATHKGEMTEESHGYFNRLVQPLGHLVPFEIRRQWGVPLNAKKEDMTDRTRLEDVEAVLDAHRGSVQGRDVNWARVDEVLETARRRDQEGGVYRLVEGESEDQDDAAMEKVLERYAGPKTQEGRGDEVGIEAGLEDFKVDVVDGDPEESCCPLTATKATGKIPELDDSSRWTSLGKRDQTCQNASKRGTTSAERSAGGSELVHQLSATSRTNSNLYEPTIGRFAPHTPLQKRRFFNLSPAASLGRSHARLLHTALQTRRQTAAALAEPFFPPPPPPPSEPSNSEIHSIRKPGIRDQLRQWQELHGNNEEDSKNLPDFDRDPNSGETSNNITRLPDAGMSLHRQDLEEEEEREAMAYFTRSPTEDLNSAATDNKFLNIGDLVELEFPRSERESFLAVFVRRLGFESQFFTINGRWVNVSERQVQYSIPGWVSPKLVEPLLDHIPVAETAAERDELRERSFMEDLSVPRQVTAPLVRRMVQFENESQEIYRRFAGTLDNAHSVLAHETDLRYGSLLSAATTLLKMPASKLPVTALFTIRKALSHAGFAFNIDRRSHRLTGYLQIRSKEQVKMVECVRNWLREWQDDMATRSPIEGDERAMKRHRTSRGAQLVYSFLEKVRKIVLKSREDREATQSNNIGPSKKRFPITRESDCVKITTGLQFTEQEAEIIRFMEAWACANMYLGLPRIESLPPLLLQATGLYPEHELVQGTGFLFLQELGTIMPYENRVRFDPHLLLPSSQHSKPLQNLMSSLLVMQDKHNFSDSMAHLRHDWGNLSVYCIDDASAHEIDDGLSIERAGNDTWWVHVHIANPTAFFERDHPLAKMARHMGESIYMPERTYMMLPRWATLRHFSLANDRPCLTYSAKMDGEGRTLEHKITPGIIRNVMRLTPEEVVKALNADPSEQGEELVLTVGGEPPPPRPSKSMLASITEKQGEELKILQRLAEKRSDRRKAAGGLFFNIHKHDVNVWQQYRASGLAWDHPYRKGSRTVEGDPVIQLKTKGLTNWFASSEDVDGDGQGEMFTCLRDVGKLVRGEAGPDDISGNDEEA